MRNRIRFPSTGLNYILIDTKIDNTKFDPEFAGLIIEESHEGCSIVVQVKYNIEKDTILKVQMYNFQVMNAVICWSKQIDHDIKKVGLKFLSQLNT